MDTHTTLDIPIVKKIELDQIPKGTVRRFWLQVTTNGLGMPVAVPVQVAKGAHEGPILGLTAAVHGNELNGIPVIQRLFSEVKPQELHGTIVGAMVVNVPAFHRRKRRFPDGTDPNHIMPGVKNGNISQVYTYRLFDRLVKNLDYLIDLHTASFGRVNSYYVRADMDHSETAQMALMQNADIIVHNPPMDGTLRGAADDAGIPAITLEVGDPNLFQKGMIRSSLTGIHNVLNNLGMTDGEIDKPSKPTVICRSSAWMYTQQGGLLRVFPEVTQKVSKGERIAEVRNVFGDILETYYAPADGVVIGKSVNPVNYAGGRILHLGYTDL